VDELERLIPPNNMYIFKLHFFF